MRAASALAQCQMLHRPERIPVWPQRQTPPRPIPFRDAPQEHQRLVLMQPRVPNPRPENLRVSTGRVKVRNTSMPSRARVLCAHELRDCLDLQRPFVFCRRARPNHACCPFIPADHRDRRSCPADRVGRCGRVDASGSSPHGGVLGGRGARSANEAPCQEEEADQRDDARDEDASRGLRKIGQHEHRDEPARQRELLGVGEGAGAGRSAGPPHVNPRNSRLANAPMTKMPSQRLPSGATGAGCGSAGQRRAPARARITSTMTASAVAR